jgi:hypothetical protein
MASAWVGVIGTAIGAGIGGVVTVVALMIKGRQEEAAEIRRNEREDQQRAEDRIWSARQQQTDKRQALYADLIRMANELVLRTDLIPDEERLNEVIQLIDRYEETEANVTLVAVDGAVIRAAFEVSSAAYAVRHQGVRADKGAHDAWCDLYDATERLVDVCRRDLGLSQDHHPTSCTPDRPTRKRGSRAECGGTLDTRDPMPAT